jgi:hypothetical protein
MARLLFARCDLRERRRPEAAMIPATVHVGALVLAGDRTSSARRVSVRFPATTAARNGRRLRRCSAFKPLPLAAGIRDRFYDTALFHAALMMFAQANQLAGSHHLRQVRAPPIGSLFQGVTSRVWPISVLDICSRHKVSPAMRGRLDPATTVPPSMSRRCFCRDECCSKHHGGCKCNKCRTKHT